MLRTETSEHERAEPDLVLDAAWAAARACGVTRLADITGLDRVGVPVFHAVRPLSRALVVHQGKGLAHRDAEVSALMEAVESACAEAFDGPRHVGAFSDLPADERAPSPADFARDRADAVGPDEPVAWTPAERLVDGRPLQVPFDCVSLDCVAPWDRRFQHTSIGLGARLHDEGAVLKGLLELLEHDATAVWRGRPLHERSMEQIDGETVPYAWFGDLAERMAGAGLSLSIHRLATIIGLPAFHAGVFAPKAPGPSARASGWACAPAAEDALQGAILEALQCRLTSISGARDDILHGRDRGMRGGEAVALPPHLQALDWTAVADGRDDLSDVTPWRIADRLARVGYPDAAVVRLAAPKGPVRVAKVFVPGLAAQACARRAIA